MPAGGNLVVLFENVFREARATPTVFAGATIAAPHTSADYHDWRAGQQVVATLTGSDFSLLTAESPGNKFTIDGYVVANHNLFSGGCTQLRALWRNGGSGSYTIATGSVVVPANNHDLVVTFAPVTADSVGLQFLAPVSSVIRIGEFTLGRRMAAANQIALPDGADPYGWRLEVEGGGMAHGSPLRSEGRYRRRRIDLSVPDPGVPDTWRTGAAPNGSAMAAHLMTGLPVWVSWNTTAGDVPSVLLARSARVGIQTLKSERRIVLGLELEAQERL